MSGIAGIIHFSERPVEAGYIENMTAAMAYRGPDGIHHWGNGSVALGHCMLHTTPESLEEHQPLANERESLVLVMDGRVDNWEELRRELLSRGAVLRDRSDAELVLRAYEIWRQDCLGHIDGDFALAIWDAERRTMFCARDRMGNKPFNYYWDGKTLAFASELQSLLRLPFVTQTLNVGILAEFLAVEWYSRDETFWHQIKRLVAAHHMIVGADGLRMEQYWQPDYQQTLPFKTDEEYFEAYRELYADCVRRMSRSHRPLAYEVSGGLDSSAIFCTAAALQRENRLLAPGLEGYTLAFPGDRFADELSYSRAVGEHVGVELHEIPPSLPPLEFYKDWALHYQDYPGTPNGIMSLDLRTLAVERGSRVLISGSGGDEWTFGQRLYYAEELAAHRWRDLYTCFEADADAFGTATALRLFIRYGIRPLLPSAIRVPLSLLRRGVSRLHSQPVDTRVRDGQWLTAHMRGVLEQRRQIPGQTPSPTFGRKGQPGQHEMITSAWIDWAGEMEERMCSRLGLDFRRPMRSPRLVQFAIATPERLRLRGRTDKYLHRQALQGVIAEAVYSRLTKAEFSVVMRAYLDALEDKFREAIADKCRNWVLPNRLNMVYDYYQDHTSLSGIPRGGKSQSILWNVLVCKTLLEVGGARVRMYQTADMTNRRDCK